MSERIRIEYEPLDDLLKLRDPDNAKGHAPAAIEESFAEHGFVSPILVDDASNVLGAGHGRLGQLEERRRAGQEPPARIEVDEAGRWLVPVIRGVRFKSAKARRKYALADNRLVELGGVGQRDPQGLAGRAGWRLRRDRLRRERPCQFHRARLGVGPWFGGR